VASPTQPKPTPIPAVLIYGTPTSPELTQASWFRAEDKQAAKAAAEALKFSVIDIQSEAEKALTVGVHEGVLKGSGRMIVGSVSKEVYRRIEEYARKGAVADASAKEESIGASGAKPVSEQTTNTTGTLVTATNSAPATAQATAPDGKPASATNSTASPPGKPENISTVPPNPWDALRIGSHVVAKYWEKDGSANGWWIAVITGVEKNDFIIRWPDEPKTPPLKIERKHVAILHSAYDVTHEWLRRR
jgi:hypothetical protein